MDTVFSEDGRSPWWRHFEQGVEPRIVIEKRSLQSYLDEAASKYPKRKAIIFQNFSMTYKELLHEAERFAAALRLRGVQNGDRVAIMLPNIPQTMIAVWGVLKAGAVAVMTNPLYMEKELTHHFHDSDARVLITLDLLWPKIEGLYDKLGLKMSVVTRVADGLAFPLNFLQPWKAKREGSLPQVPYDHKNIVSWKSFMSTKERYAAQVDDPETTLALLQYTGGTTGVSKAAMLTHYNMVAQMQILGYIIGEAPEKGFTFLGILPFFHIFGLGGNIFLTAFYKGSTIPVPRYTPTDLLRTIDKYRPNFFIGVPSVYISLIQQKDLPKYDLSCIDLCISGSAPFPKEALSRFQKLTGARVTEGLGLTEASPCITANPLYGLQKVGSVGVCLPATEVRIVDMETGKMDMPVNELGEIIVRGPQVMAGYWNNDDETDLTLRDGWLFTGDIGYRDEDGYFYVSDRKKDMVIIGGYNVYPREVDEVLYEHPKVAEAVTVGIPHRTRGEILKAYVVAKQDVELLSSELVAHCRVKLANYKIPKAIEFCESLPKTLVGKVLRRALREQEVQKLKEGGHWDEQVVIEEDFVDEALEVQKEAQKAATLRLQAEEMMLEARKKAEEMLNEARLKGEEMIFETRARAEKLLEQAKEMAREKAEEVTRTFSDGVGKALKSVRKDEKPPDECLPNVQLSSTTEHKTVEHTDTAHENTLPLDVIDSDKEHNNNASPQEAQPLPEKKD